MCLATTSKGDNFNKPHSKPTGLYLDAVSILYINSMRMLDNAQNHSDGIMVTSLMLLNRIRTSYHRSADTTSSITNCFRDEMFGGRPSAFHSDSRFVAS
jgi:hypothetical protein